VSQSGSVSVSPAATITYTLDATNASGTTSKSVILTVTVPVVRITYNTDIRPIMQSDCVMCHGGPDPSAGRDFSTYNGVMTVVRPGDATSRLIQMTQPGGRMHTYLTGDRVGKAETIRRWIVEFAAAEQ
jgi:hypothetical protein